MLWNIFCTYIINSWKQSYAFFCYGHLDQNNLQLPHSIAIIPISKEQLCVLFFHCLKIKICLESLGTRTTHIRPKCRMNPCYYFLSLRNNSVLSFVMVIRVKNSFESLLKL